VSLAGPPGPAWLGLVRHGEPNVPPGTFVGQLDPPLSPAGRADAAALAAALGGWRGARILSSDLRRAAETATALAAVVGGRLELDPRWREIALGAWEGWDWARLERCAPEAAAAYLRDHRPPEAPGGEPRAALAARVTAALAAAPPEPGGRLLVVTHLGPIRHLLALCLRLDPVAAERLRVDRGSLTVLARFPDGARLDALNWRPGPPPGGPP